MVLQSLSSPLVTWTAHFSFMANIPCFFLIKALFFSMPRIAEFCALLIFSSGA